MSGGSMDYLYSRVVEANFDENTPERVDTKTQQML